jgi:hypothetical protein
MNNTAKKTLQILMGLIIVFILYRIALLAMNKDRLGPGQKAVDHNVDTLIVDGWTYMTLMHNRFYTTLNPYASNYLAIRPSFNRHGGIQFTYQFWVNLRSADSDTVKFKDILLKGEPGDTTYREVRFTDPDFEAATGVREDARNVTTVAVKCPRIRFGPTFDSLQVEINTVHDPDARFLVRGIDAPPPNGSLRRNVQKLAQDKWMLVTFTFEDHVEIDNHERGVVIRMYLNDTLYATKQFKSAMRPNKSPLHTFPNSSIPDSRIGNLRYFNRALTHTDVAGIFAAGHPTKFFDPAGPGEQLRLSEHNKADADNF